MLHAALVRSRHAHAAVLGIDTAAALTAAGVVDVLTAADLPGQLCTGPVRSDRPVLAAGVVRHIGEPVAAVLAIDLASATRAASALAVNYRPLPEVHHFRGEQADPIHPEGNLLRSVRVRRGDPVPALDWADRSEFDPEEPGAFTSPLPDADLVVDGAYSTHGWAPRHAVFGSDGGPPVVTPIEAEPTDGGVRIRAARRWHPEDRDQLASCLELMPSQIELETANGPRDFSTDLGRAVIVAVLARRHSRPVRLTAGPIRSGEYGWPALGEDGGPLIALRYRHHARSDGTLVAVQGEIAVEAGSYAGVIEPAVAQICAIAVGPYRVPAIDIRVYAVRSTTSPPMIEPGVIPAAVTFAIEAQLDRLARRITAADHGDSQRCLADRRTVRERNLLPLDAPLPTGQLPLEDSPLPALFAALGDIALPDRPDLGSEYAWGIGEGTGMVPFGAGEGADIPVRASVEITDGQVSVRCAAAEGDPHLEAAALGAVTHALGPEVRFHPTGEPAAGGSAASVGLAVQAAVDALTAPARERLAARAGMSPGLLHAAGGRLRSFDGVIDVPLLEATAGDPAFAEAWFNPTPSEVLGVEGQGDAFPGYAYAAARAVLRMTSVGEVEIVQLVVAADCGRVLDADRARAAVTASADTGIRLAMPEATIAADAVQVHLLGGAAPKSAAGVAAGAVAAALRSAADQAAGGDADVLPVPGVSWSRNTPGLPDGARMPLVYRDPESDGAS